MFAALLHAHMVIITCPCMHTWSSSHAPACTHGHHHMPHVQCTHLSEVVCMHAICFSAYSHVCLEGRSVHGTAWTSYIEVVLESQSHYACCAISLEFARRSIVQLIPEGFSLTHTHGEKMASYGSAVLFF